MNTALGFLFYRLSGRRFVRWLNSLRHPGRLLGLVSCVAGFGLLFRFRDADFVQELVKSTPMGLVIALAGFVSLIRGLMQKGIPFDPPDMEYLCCGPFSHRAVLFYRLLPSYLSAVFFCNSNILLARRWSSKSIANFGLCISRSFAEHPSDDQSEPLCRVTFPINLGKTSEGALGCRVGRNLFGDSNGGKG
jgi:hypothetical protein